MGGGARTTVRLLGRLGALGGVGVTSFLGGIWLERQGGGGGGLFAASPISPADRINPPLTPSEDKVDSAWLSEGSSKSSPSRVSQIMKFGFPGMDNVRSFNDFVVSYDRRNRVPHWVAEHLTASSVKFNAEVDRAKCDFHEDLSVHPYFRSTNADYKGSGLDRGHLAAAGNHRLHQSLVEETFVLSNMAPQVGKGFNRDAWNNLEKHVRGLTKKYDNVYVVTGPLYLPHRDQDSGKMIVRYRVIGKNNVAVPSHFFKVIVGEMISSGGGGFDLEAYVMPNAPIDDKAKLEAFRVPLDAVERAAGLLFFDRIPKTQFRQINGRRV